ncbi:hypothetical protein N7450_001878 [Penicillium hetheringtonii]|uniref:Actin-like ATPase domain-containing protein n=1 Tax=Penicillium hetheringtonii TaxID=911720 RepID=A0AAD6H337_9EURO|nr:hypothetical protein N7450_001878 [Penicillium hetheringtonii]
MAPFKDEHILLIQPGSGTTLAQLGLPEAYTPAKHRFPTRMFPAEKPGEYEPHRIRKVTTKVPAPSTTSNEPPKEDVEMKDAANGATAEGNPAGQDASGNTEKTEEETVEETYYEEDVFSEEGAVYPIQDGRIVNREALFALLQHIYNLLSPPLHTPIVIVAQPIWSVEDRNEITRFVFEHLSAPAFSYVDAAFAAIYGLGVKDALVVDVGKTKADVTAVVDYQIQRRTRSASILGLGGDSMTDRLLELLGSKGFTREMCEQLKRSDITEILPPGTPLPASASQTAHQGAPPAAPATDSTGNPSAPTEGATENNGDNDEGVLDVAAIVSGNTLEYLANMEKDKSSNKKAGADPKQPKLPNSQKSTASFQFEEFVEIDDETAPGGAKRYKRNTREITVGVERFLAATPLEWARGLISRGILEDIAAQINYVINGVDASRRSDLWNSLAIVGAGSKVQGFTQALLAVCQEKFILAPSASFFTSEIPSTFSTPLPTGGTNTPAPMAQGQGQPGPMFHPAAHGVNPLLVAATHNNPGMPLAPGTPGMDPNIQQRSSGHVQAPNSVKTLKFPEYFSEFKDNGNRNAPGASSGPGSTSHGSHGHEEAIFLGAQIAAKIFFVVDQGQSKSFMSRTEYNELGPEGMREYAF